MSEEENWFDDYAVGDEEVQIDEYDITASPNDFNILTLFSFIESGAVKIPGFQRNFVWDRVRASKLIEVRSYWVFRYPSFSYTNRLATNFWSSTGNNAS